ncbi:hypothetical protein PPTG_07930 [Phytophthora nicotianae INRA-310]|nr:hypothetical protein PPTG_07930 [Phytophthora nicotianae INRA-310]ETN14300.1 hypothetical protein PPTG_07930 [Phytophthora nicotianae INRA-310]
MATAREMWTTLVEDNTVRDYSYMMTLRSQLYALKHVQGQPMSEYLSNMGRTRQLLNIVDPTHAISDDEMARILVMGVMQTHRDLVDQFYLLAKETL